VDPERRAFVGTEEPIRAVEVDAQFESFLHVLMTAWPNDRSPMPLNETLSVS
jgi:hypothetical protein